MREIKFRAWDKKYEKMENFTNPKDGLMYQDGEMFVSSGWDGESNPTFDDVDIERYILMQYTGLKDANGVEIYEGDVVEIERHTDDCDGTEYDCTTPVFGPFEWGMLTTRRDIMVVRSVKAIGNIHANPKLGAT